MDLSHVNWRKSSYSTSNSNCVEVDLVWRKSSYSGSNGGGCVEVGMVWRKSNYSSSDGACVEVGIAPRASGTTSDGGGRTDPSAGWPELDHGASTGGNCVEVGRPVADVVAVRDSKDPQGPVLTFSPAAWQAFTGQLKTGELGLG